MADGGASASFNLPLEEGRIYTFPPTGRGGKEEIWTVQGIDPKNGNVLLGRIGKNNTVSIRSLSREALSQANAKPGRVLSSPVAVDSRIALPNGTARVAGFDAGKNQVLLIGLAGGNSIQRWVDADTVSGLVRNDPSATQALGLRSNDGFTSATQGLEAADIVSKGGKKVGTSRVVGANTIEIQDTNGYAYGQATVQGNTATLLDRDGNVISTKKLRSSSLSQTELADIGAQVRQHYLKQYPDVETEEGEQSQTQAKTDEDEPQTKAKTDRAARTEQRIQDLRTNLKEEKETQTSESSAKSPSVPLAEAASAVAGSALAGTVLPALGLQAIPDTDTDPASTSASSDDTASRTQERIQELRDRTRNNRQLRTKTPAASTETTQPRTSSRRGSRQTQTSASDSKKANAAQIQAFLNEKRTELGNLQAQEQQIIAQVRTQSGQPRASGRAVIELASPAQQAQIQTLRAQIDVTTQQIQQAGSGRIDVTVQGSAPTQASQATIQAEVTVPSSQGQNATGQATVEISQPSASASPSDISYTLNYMRDTANLQRQAGQNPPAVTAQVASAAPGAAAVTGIFAAPLTLFNRAKDAIQMIGERANLAQDINRLQQQRDGLLQEYSTLATQISQLQAAKQEAELAGDQPRVQQIEISLAPLQNQLEDNQFNMGAVQQALLGAVQGLDRNIQSQRAKSAAPQIPFAPPSAPLSTNGSPAPQANTPTQRVGLGPDYRRAPSTTGAPRGQGANDVRQSPEAWMSQYGQRAPVQLQQGLALDAARQREARQSDGSMGGEDTSLGDSYQESMSTAGGGAQPLLGLGQRSYTSSSPEGTDAELESSGDQQPDYFPSSAEDTARFMESQRRQTETGQQFQSQPTYPSGIAQDLPLDQDRTEAYQPSPSIRPPAAPSDQQGLANQLNSDKARESAAQRPNPNQPGTPGAPAAPSKPGPASDFDKIRDVFNIIYRTAVGTVDIVDLILLVISLNLRLIYTFIEMPLLPILIASIDGKLEKVVEQSKQNNESLKSGTALIAFTCSLNGCCCAFACLAGAVQLLMFVTPVLVAVGIAGGIIKALR